MAHPQSSPRGHFAKERIDVGGAQITADTTGNLELNAGLSLSGETTDTITQNSTAVLFAAGIALSGETTDVITQNSTGVKLAGGIWLGGETAAADLINQNSTGVILPYASALPSTRERGTFVAIRNSTGSAIGFHTTGTTWKYANVTSVQPT